MEFVISGSSTNTRLKKLRKERKLTQKQLADQAQVSQSAVCYIENGERSPTLYTLERLAEALEVELHELF